MQFPLVFDRRKGGSGSVKVLGADAVPDFDNPSLADDYILNSRIVSVNGWPPHRVAVVVRFVGDPAGSVADVPVTAYFYERASGAWYQVSAAVNVTPVASKPGGANYQAGKVAFLDCVALLDFPAANATREGPTGGNLALAILAADPGAGAPSGTYRIAAGVDMTTFP